MHWVSRISDQRDAASCLVRIILLNQPRQSEIDRAQLSPVIQKRAGCLQLAMPKPIEVKALEITLGEDGFR